MRKRVNVWGFFAAIYAASWLIWAPAILWRGEQPSLLLVILGAFVPSAMGIVFTYLTQDRAGRRDFWQRVVDVRRIGWRWWAVIVLVFPLTYGVSGIAFNLLGGNLPPLSDILAQLANPGLVAQLVVANLIVGVQQHTAQYPVGSLAPLFPELDPRSAIWTAGCPPDRLLGPVSGTISLLVLAIVAVWGSKTLTGRQWPVVPGKASVA